MIIRAILLAFIPGIVAGILAARLMSTPAAQRGLLVAITVGTLLTAFAGFGAYDAGLQQSLFITRLEMAALGCDVLLGTLAVAATVAATGRRGGWLPARALRIPGQDILTVGLAAFALGMFVYLITYPPTAWAFRTLVALMIVLALLLTLALPAAEAPRLGPMLQSVAGLAAAFVGLVAGSPAMILLGAFVLAAATALARQLGAGSSMGLRTLWGTAFAIVPADRQT